MRSLHYWTILHAESSNTKITFFSNWIKKIILKLPNYRRLFQIAHYNQHEGRFSKIPNKIVKRSGPQSSAGKVHGRPYNTAHESCLFNKRAEQSPKCRASLTPLHSLQHAVSDPIIINSFSSAKGNQHTSKNLFLVLYIGSSCNTDYKTEGFWWNQEQLFRAGGRTKCYVQASSTLNNHPGDSTTNTLLCTSILPPDIFTLLLCNHLGNRTTGNSTKIIIPVIKVQCALSSATLFQVSIDDELC